MSKKRVRNMHRRADMQRKSRRSIALTSVALILLLAGSVVSLNSSVPRKAVAWISPPPSPTPTLTKEYIYAGDRLVATEEPSGVTPPSAPANVLADTFSATRIDLTWTASPGADRYEVERATNITGTFTPLNTNVTATNYSDTTVSSINAYIYRVRAVNAGGSSLYSNMDIATAITFTDDPLVVASTEIKAVHITQLRQAVDAMRTATNLPAFSWTDTNLAGVEVKALHLQQLRDNLDQALSAVGITPSAYTDLPLNSIEIKKIHLDQLRQRVR